MITIIVEQRRDDWMAYLKGHPEIWECAPSLLEAVDKLESYRKEEILDAIENAVINGDPKENVVGILGEDIKKMNTVLKNNYIKQVETSEWITQNKQPYGISDQRKADND